MQGLADGYFVLPYTIGDYLSDWLNTEPVSTDDDGFTQAMPRSRARAAVPRASTGHDPSTHFHRRLGHLMIEYCGLARSREGLEKAIAEIGRSGRILEGPQGARDVRQLNQSLERAGRVADFLELAELMCIDALDREESCGGHFRVEHQTEDGEASGTT